MESQLGSEGKSEWRAMSAVLRQSREYHGKKA
jgi:hypothetical protein